MDREDRMRMAPGETDERPPAPKTGLSPHDAVEKDRAYTPGSETETAQKQENPLPDTIDDDIDEDAIKVAPGTGGPDDVGEIEVDPADLNMPGRE